MKDIKEIAEKYTREDFLNEAAKSGSLFLCPRYSGLNQKCLSIVYDEKKCKECWKDNEIKTFSDEIDKLGAKIVLLEEDNKEYKRANEGLAAESKERLKTINKLKRLIEENTENAILSNKVEDLEDELKLLKNTYNLKQTQWENEQVKQVEVLMKENSNLNGLIEKKDIKIEKLEQEVKSLKEIINEENEQLTNEYSNKIIIAEQEINRLKESLTIKNDIAEKYFKENENLKDAVKKLAEVL